MTRRTQKPEAWLTVTLSIAGLILAGGYAVSLFTAPAREQTIVVVPSPTPKIEKKPSPSVTMPPQSVRFYDWGTYKSCTVYSRSNMNTYGSNINVLGYSSEIRCNIDGTEKTLVSVTDKKGFPDAANSIYRFWQDSDGYKVLLVDQNGAGSGEGHGKIVQLFNDYGVTRSCFYFVSHNFVRENVPIEWAPLYQWRSRVRFKKT